MGIAIHGGGFVGRGGAFGFPPGDGGGVCNGGGGFLVVPIPALILGPEGSMAPPAGETGTIIGLLHTGR